MYGDAAFGAWLRALRMARQLSRPVLAAHAGCAAITLRKIEEGQRRLSPELAGALAQELSLSPEDTRQFLAWAQARLPGRGAALRAVPELVTHFAGAVLPSPLTPLIGRAVEVQLLQEYLQAPEIRLITLIGPPGVGKTRLALAGASAVPTLFPDGIWFVSLAHLSDPHLLADAIAQAVGLAAIPDQPLAARLPAFLRPRHLLLLLDNFEHLTTAAPLLIDLLTIAPAVKVLVTSRAVLRLEGEHMLPVSPLPWPDPEQLLPLAILAQVPAVALFIARAQAAQPAFRLTPATAPQVAAICAQLEGLPLALELAAARLRSLPLPALLTQLDQRLAVLTRGSQSHPPRQQSLRAAIRWSYDLLDGPERALFRRLAVFGGSYTPEAVAAVCNSAGDLGADIPEALATLVDQSLLQPKPSAGGRVRYGMLDSLRVFADELLIAQGEARLLHQQHANYYARLAEQAAAGLQGPHQLHWWELLLEEQPNLRVALRWALDHAAGDIAWRMVGALGLFWERHSQLHEGRRWAEAALALSGGDAAAHAQVLYVSGVLAFRQGDYITARARLAQSIELGERQPSMPGLVAALAAQVEAAVACGDLTTARSSAEAGRIYSQRLEQPPAAARMPLALGLMQELAGNYSAAQASYEESQVLVRQGGDTWAAADGLAAQARVAWTQGDDALAATYWTEALTLYQITGNIWQIAHTLLGLANVAQAQGATSRAQALYTEAQPLFQALADPAGTALAQLGIAQAAAGAGDILQAEAYGTTSLRILQGLDTPVALATCLRALGYLNLVQGRTAQARTFFMEGLSRSQAMEDRRGVVAGIAGLSGLLMATGAAGSAVQLAGFVAVACAQHRMRLDPIDQRVYDQQRVTARAQLTTAGYDAAWTAGHVLTTDAALELARAGGIREGGEF